jgi:hypothetical protein
MAEKIKMLTNQRVADLSAFLFAQTTRRGLWVIDKPPIQM